VDHTLPQPEEIVKSEVQPAEVQSPVEAPPKRGRGAPRRFTPEVEASVADDLRKGNTPSQIIARLEKDGHKTTLPTIREIARRAGLSVKGRGRPSSITPSLRAEIRFTVFAFGNSAKVTAEILQLPVSTVIYHTRKPVTSEEAQTYRPIWDREAKGYRARKERERLEEAMRQDEQRRETARTLPVKITSDGRVIWKDGAEKLSPKVKNAVTAHAKEMSQGKRANLPETEG